jgi:hypothetical protein
MPGITSLPVADCHDLVVFDRHNALLYQAVNRERSESQNHEIQVLGQIPPSH